MMNMYGESLPTYYTFSNARTIDRHNMFHSTSELFSNYHLKLEDALLTTPSSAVRYLCLQARVSDDSKLCQSQNCIIYEFMVQDTPHFLIPEGSNIPTPRCVKTVVSKKIQSAVNYKKD